MRCSNTYRANVQYFCWSRFQMPPRFKIDATFFKQTQKFQWSDHFFSFCSIAYAPHQCQRHPHNSFSFDALSIFSEDVDLTWRDRQHLLVCVCASCVCVWFEHFFLLFLVHTATSFLYYAYKLRWTSCCRFSGVPFFFFECKCVCVCMPFVQHFKVILRSLLPYKRLETLIFGSYTSKIVRTLSHIAQYRITHCARTPLPAIDEASQSVSIELEPKRNEITKKKCFFFFLFCREQQIKPKKGKRTWMNERK